MSNIIYNSSGYDGSCGTSGYFGGGPGGNGTGGGNANNITLYMTSDSNKCLVTWRETSKAEERNLTDDFGITLIATGGNGGSGGRGGDGIRGHDGRDGDSWNLNGGNGGNGGPGGHGGDGGHGADGGQIKVQVNHQNLDLLTFVDSYAVSGGKGGRGGSGGYGGPGGSGGRAGSRTDYYYENGIRKSRTVYGCSGSSGFSGPDGMSGCSGRDGRDGTFYYEVDGRCYEKRYDPYIDSSAVVVSKSNDSIYEPGELVDLTNIKLMNRTTMPTPDNSPIMKIVATNIVTATNSYVNNYTILNNVVTVERPLTCVITHPNYISHNKPYVVNTKLEVSGQISQRIPRLFKRENFHSSPPTITVEYPVAISLVSCVRSITIQDEAPIAFQIKNKSTEDVGADSFQGRRVQVYIVIDNEEVTSKDICFIYKDSSKRVLIDQKKILIEDINFIAAQDKVSISGTLKFKTLYPANFIVRLRLGLEIGHIENIQMLNPIQFSEFSLQQVERFNVDDKDPNKLEILLVSNSETSDRAIKSWENYCKLIGIDYANWNMSYEKITLFKKIYGGKSIAEIFENKIIVIFNNEYKDHDNNTIIPSTLVNNSDAFHSFKKHNVRFYLIGESADVGYFYFNLSSIIPDADKHFAVDNSKFSDVTASVIANLPETNKSILEKPLLFDEEQPGEIGDENGIIRQSTLKEVSNNFIKYFTSGCCKKFDNKELYEAFDRIRKKIKLNSSSNSKTKDKEFDLFFYPKFAKKKSGCFCDVYHMANVAVREGLDNKVTKFISRKCIVSDDLEVADYYNVFKLMTFDRKLNLLEILVSEVFPDVFPKQQSVDNNFSDNFGGNNNNTTSISPGIILNCLMDSIVSDLVQELVYYINNPYLLEKEKIPLLNLKILDHFTNFNFSHLIVEPQIKNDFYNKFKANLLKNIFMKFSAYASKKLSLLEGCCVSLFGCCMGDTVLRINLLKGALRLVKEKVISVFKSIIPNDSEFVNSTKKAVSDEGDNLFRITDTPYSKTVFDTNSREVFNFDYKKYDLSRFDIGLIRKPITYTQVCYIFTNEEERVLAIESFEKFKY